MDTFFFFPNKNIFGNAGYFWEDFFLIKIMIFWGQTAALKVVFKNLKTWGSELIKTSILENVKCPCQWLMKGLTMENSRFRLSPQELLFKAIDRLKSAGC